MEVKNKFWSDDPVLEKELDQVALLMKKQIKIQNKDIRQAIFDLLDAGGKRLRPAYLLLFAGFTSLKKEETYALAASIELLHTATLIHDDVIDHADTRRGVKTLSTKYSPEIAVYGGDYLFVAVFKLLAQHTFDTSNLVKHIDAMERLLGGELGQLDHHFDLNQSMADYLKNISGKTGELFALSACAAPLVQKENRLASLANKIGMAIGIAFQIMDDYLDYASDEATLGKPVFEDVKQGIYSAPVLFALEENRPVVEQLILNEQYDALYHWIKNSHALESTKNLARTYTNTALDLIEKLPDHKNKKSIAQLTYKLLERTL